MKSLELNLKKRLLIVERPEGKSTEEALSEYEGKDKWEFLVFGSDLTEEKIIELNIVETKLYGSAPGFCTIAYEYGTGKNGFRPGFCAPNGKQFTNSFISAIKAQGWYWGENPIQNPEQPPFINPKLSGFSENDVVDYKYELHQYNEAESRTFHPERVLIFEIVEGQS